MHCITCQKEIISNNKRKIYCDNNCKNKNSNIKHQNYVNQQERGLQRKLMLISLLGGKCAICSYSKNSAALCFHHNDESIKSFGIDIRACSNSSIQKLIEEANKCTLLCHNCHMETHYPYLILST